MTGAPNRQLAVLSIYSETCSQNIQECILMRKLDIVFCLVMANTPIGHQTDTCTIFRVSEIY